MTALPGARVVGERLHPTIHEMFTVIEGELTVIRDGQQSMLRAGESAEIEPGVWHDWFNRGSVDAVVRVEVTPGERFAHISDVIVFRKPPPNVQRIVFGALAPIARRRGYGATYASLSRTTLAPRAPSAVPA